MKNRHHQSTLSNSLWIFLCVSFRPPLTQTVGFCIKSLITTQSGCVTVYGSTRTILPDFLSETGKRKNQRALKTICENLAQKKTRRDVSQHALGSANPTAASQGRRLLYRHTDGQFRLDWHFPAEIHGGRSAFTPPLRFNHRAATWAVLTQHRLRCVSDVQLIGQHDYTQSIISYQTASANCPCCVQKCCANCPTVCIYAIFTQ